MTKRERLKRELAQGRKIVNWYYFKWQDGEISEKQYQGVRKEIDRAHRMILAAAIRDPKIKPYVQDRTVWFQASPVYEDGNHQLGRDLEKAFAPYGHDDSEMSQGFFYINRGFIPAVKEYLHGRATGVAVRAGFPWSIGIA